MRVLLALLVSLTANAQSEWGFGAVLGTPSILGIKAVLQSATDPWGGQLGFASNTTGDEAAGTQATKTVIRADARYVFRLPDTDVRWYPFLGFASLSGNLTGGTNTSESMFSASGGVGLEMRAGPPGGGLGGELGLMYGLSTLEGYSSIAFIASMSLAIWIK